MLIIRQKMMLLKKFCYLGMLCLLSGCISDSESECTDLGRVRGTSSSNEAYGGRYEAAIKDAKLKAEDLGGNTYQVVESYSDENITRVVVVIKDCKKKTPLPQVMVPPP